MSPESTGGALVPYASPPPKRAGEEGCLAAAARVAQQSGTIVAGAAVCLLWVCASTSLILLNKHIMTGLNFRFPLTLSMLGQAFSAVAAFVACRVLRVVKEKAADRVDRQFYVTRILPIGFFSAATLATGNWVYLYLTLALIQMLKAFTPVVTMFVTFAFGLDRPTCRLIMSVLVICVGCALSSFGEANMSATGLLLMFLAEFTEAMKLVSMQKYLQSAEVGFHPIEGLMYFAPACVFWMIPGIAAIELQRMRAAGALDIVTANWHQFAAAAAMGFVVNLLAIIVVKWASGLGFKVLGQAKNAGACYLGMLVFGEKVRQQQSIGYGIALGGVLWYTAIKSAPKPAPAAPADDAAAREPADSDGQAAALTGQPSGLGGGTGSGAPPRRTSSPPPQPGVTARPPRHDAAT